MKENRTQPGPLIKAYILIEQIRTESNINNSLFILKKMCNKYGDEFTKNVNLISFNHINFKNLEEKSSTKEPFFFQYFLDFIENDNFLKIFSNLLMDAKIDFSVSEIFNGLKNRFNLNIEQQIKVILSFIDSGVENYVKDANLLFLEKCKEIYEQKLFHEFKSNINVEKIINKLFNLLKIKNIQDNINSNATNENKNDSDEANIQLYIQSFSHCNEKLKRNLQDKANVIDINYKGIGEIDSIFNDSKIKYKIEIEKILYELGPLIINQKINLSENAALDSNLDLKRISEFILYIINNKEVKISNHIKYLNKIFLLAMNEEINQINDIDNIQINNSISWDINSLYELLKNSLKNIDIRNLLISFDNPIFIIDNKNKFDFFTEILKKFKFFGENTDINNIQYYFDNFIFIKWKNTKNQIKILELIISNKEISENSIFSLRNYQGQKIRRDIELKAYTSSKNQYLIENWRNVKLIETLLLISEEDNYNIVKKIFDWALKNIPEIIIMALLIIKVDYNENILMKDLILEILSSILNDKNPRVKLIDEIWKTNKDLVIFTLYNSWKKFPDLMNLSLIFDLSNSLLKDSLLPLVNSKYHNFSVHLGLLASKRDYLHIEQWIKKNIEKYGDSFINSLLYYLKTNIIQPCRMNANTKENNKSYILEKAQLSLESLTIILNALNTYNNQGENDNYNLSVKTKKEIEDINKIISDIYDEIQDHQINSEEIEREVNQLLRNLLEEKTSVDEIIGVLINYKESSDKRQNEIFSCLIHGLLDEYRFYGQYPKNKLKLISELFGKIINNKLLEGVIETLALKYILEGIKAGSGMLYFFGINALTQFLGKISHWPSYMKILLDLDQIKKNKDIYILIFQENEKSQNKIINNFSEKSVENSDKYLPLVPISQSENKSIGENINNSHINTSINNDNIKSINKSKDSKIKVNENVDKLKNKLSGVTKSFTYYEYNNINNYEINIDDKKIEVPNEELLNKTKKIFDSLNKSNIYEKSLEIINLLGNDIKIIRWFSYYFTTVKINHWKNIPFRIFNDLFNQINNPILSKYILNDTIKYIQELLSMECLYIDDKCKSLLQNLGIWLGFNTLFKNKPILAKDIDFRELITKSYKNGELNTIIPFICKVFSFISKSKVFNINNPWINAILSLLKEIYHKSLLSFPLKSEIENLFQFLKIEMSSLSNSNKYLNKIKRLESKNHDFSDSQKYQINIDIKELTKKISSLNDYINNLLSILINDKNRANGFYYSNKYFNYFNNINENESHDNENNSNKKSLDKQKEIVTILTNIMNQSILDTIPDLINLCVENPINSAITIVNKDFTFESDLNKYRTALDNTLHFILKSFSMIEGHDKLKRNIDSNLEKYYKVRRLKKETINKIKELPNNEYINIGLEYIQIFIMKEAQNKLSVNKKVIDEIDKRKNGNLNLSKNEFYKEYVSKVKDKMPIILKPNELYIKDNEYKIYENFKTNGFTLFEEDTNKSSFLNTVYRILKEVMDKSSNDKSPNKIYTCKNYDVCMKNIQNISKKNAFYNYDEDQQLICLKKIIVDSKITEPEICRELAIKTFQYIMESIKINNYLLLNVYIYILRGWVKLNTQIADIITEYLFEYDIDIFTKFKCQLHLYLLKQKVLNHHLYENYMIKLLLGSSVNNIIIQNLLNYSFANNNNNTNYNNINQKNYMKIKSYFYDKNSKTYYLLFNKRTSLLNGLINNYTNYKPYESKDIENNEKIISFVCYFVNVIQNFYKEIYQNEKEDEVKKIANVNFVDEFLHYFQKILDLCINNLYGGNFVKYMNFFYPENISIFIIHTLKNTDNKNKIILFKNILSKIINSFHKDYLLSVVNFNQKKYYKLFMNLIYLISNNLENENNNKKSSLNYNYDKKTEYILLICDILKILSPMNYPGFILAWIDLISYNTFIDNFLDTNLVKENSNKYEKYVSLLAELLSFLNISKNKKINFYHQKVILDKIYEFFFILSNSYPSFISSYSYILLSYFPLSSFCEDEDSNDYLQLKNIILSAKPLNFIDFEKNFRETSQNFYEDDFFILKMFKEHLIPNKISKIFFSKDKIKNNDDFELDKLLDKYINESSVKNNLELILNYFYNIKNERELYNKFHGIILYWCHKKQNQQINENNIKKNPFFNFYFFLLTNLNEIYKNYLIDTIINALRFPSSQTINYSLLFQELFINIDNEDLKMLLIAKLFKRMLYNPIPWGIKYTLNCLFINEKFNQWKNQCISENEEFEDFINIISNILTEDEIRLKTNK